MVVVLLTTWTRTYAQPKYWRPPMSIFLFYYLQADGFCTELGSFFLCSHCSDTEAWGSLPSPGPMATLAISSPVLQARSQWMSSKLPWLSPWPFCSLYPGFHFLFAFSFSSFSFSFLLPHCFLLPVLQYLLITIIRFDLLVEVTCVSVS